MIYFTVFQRVFIQKVLNLWPAAVKEMEGFSSWNHFITDVVEFFRTIDGGKSNPRLTFGGSNRIPRR